MTRVARAIAVFAALLVAACSNQHAGFPADQCVEDCPTGGEVLVIEPGSVLLLVDNARQLTATLLFADGSRRDVTGSVEWASANTRIFTVAPGGAVTGISGGESAVTARLTTLEARARVLVSELPVRDFVVSPAFGRVLPGLTQQYRANAILTDGSAVDITNDVDWSVGNAATASIDAHGVALGIADGATEVYARYVLGASQASGSAILAVSSSTVTIEDLIVEPVETVTLAGTQVTHRAVAVTSENERIDVTARVQWQSSNTAVATVDATGVATTLAAGDTDIRATLRHQSSTRTAISRLRVIAPAVAGLRVSPQWTELLAGQQQIYRAIAVFTDSSEVDVTRHVLWRSDAPAVASITIDGVASALAPGQALISATMTLQGRTFSDDGALRVTAPPPAPTSLSVIPINATVLVGDELQYQCVASFPDGSQFDVTNQCRWSVTNESVAVIGTLTGLLTAVGAGATEVTARFAWRGTELSATVPVNVPAPIIIDALQVTPAVTSAAPGTTVQFSAHLVFRDGRKLDVSHNVMWTSDDPRIAIAGPGGTVRARGTGQTAIRAAGTYQGVEYSDAAQLDVISPDIVVIGLRVVPPLQSVDVGHRAQFDAELLYSNGETAVVTDTVHWTTSDENIAQSTETPGEFIGLGPGTTTVRATLSHSGGSFEDTARLSVVLGNAVSGLEITPESPVLAVGGQQQMQAWLLLGNGESIDVTPRGTWTSSNSGVAAIGADGLLTAFSAGETTITKTLIVGGSSISATVLARVVDPATQLVALRVSPSESRALIGTETKFDATAIYLDGSTQDVSAQARWNIADAAVAELTSQDGLVLAKAEGATAVTARYSANGIEFHDDAELIVPAPLIDVVEIQVTPALASVAAGDRARFSATAVLSDHRHIDVTRLVQWQSSDENIARLTRRPGEFKTFLQGTAAISATLYFRGQSHQSQAALIATAGEPRFLEVSPPTLRLTVGQQDSLQAIVHFSDGATEDVTGEAAWASEDPGIAHVGSAIFKGLVTGKSAGATRVSATYRETLSGSAAVQVVEPTLLSIELIPGSAQIPAGVVQPFTAIGTYDDESSLDVTARSLWTSSDESVAGIVPGEPRGMATGLAPGSTAINAALDGVAGSASLVVIAATVVSVEVAPASARIVPGAEKQFIAIAHLSDGGLREVTRDVTWISSNDAVASVSNVAGTQGVALGLAAGTTQIQAWYQGTLLGESPLEVAAPAISALLVRPENASTRAGSNVYYTAVAILTDATQIDVTRHVSWKSSNPLVAGISNGEEKGVATALNSGVTTISAALGTLVAGTNLLVTETCNGKEDSVLVVSDVTVRVGDTAQLQVVGVFPDGCVQDLTGDSATVWKSSDSDVFTVGNKSGVVTGIGVGVATAEVKHRSNTDTATVTVIP